MQKACNDSGIKNRKLFNTMFLCLQVFLSLTGIVFLTRISVSNIVTVILFFALLTYYMHMNMTDDRRTKKYALLISLFLLMVSILGQRGKDPSSIVDWFAYKEVDTIVDSIQHMNYEDLTFKTPWLSKANLPWLMLEIAGLFILYYRLSISVLKYANRQSRDRIDNGGNAENKDVIACAFLILIPFLIYYLIYYPGILTYDSTYQLQMATGEMPLSNAHPILSTLLIRYVFNFGKALGLSSTDAVALITLLQMMVVSAGMLYALIAIKELYSVPKWVLYVTSIYCGSLPLYGAYAVTVWKDVPFSLSVLLTAVQMLKIWKKSSADKAMDCRDVIAYVVFSSLVCLLRHNGISFVVLSTLYLLGKFRNKKAYLPMLFLPYLLLALEKYALLPMLNINEYDNFLCVIALPVQQVCAVVSKDGAVLGQSDLELVTKLASVEEIRACFNPRFNDPIRQLIGSQGMIIKSELDEYVGLWMRLGLKHPLTYFTTFIEGSVGYWSPDIQYLQQSIGVGVNDMGITASPVITIDTFKLATLSRRLPVYSMLLSNGFYFVSYALLGIVAKYKKNKTISMLVVPFVVFAVIIFMGAPIYAETRYVFPLFLSFPFILLAFHYDDRSITYLDGNENMEMNGK